MLVSFWTGFPTSCGMKSSSWKLHLIRSEPLIHHADNKATKTWRWSWRDSCTPTDFELIAIQNQRREDLTARSYFSASPPKSFACAKSHNLDLMSCFTLHSSRSLRTLSLSKRITTRSRSGVNSSLLTVLISALLCNRSLMRIVGLLRTDQVYVLPFARSSMMPLHAYVNNVHPASCSRASVLKP